MQEFDMKAAYIENAGEPMIVKTHKKPVPARGEVLIRIHYAALNHRDLWILKGQYAGRKENLILGSDGAGTVEGVGEAVQPGWEGKQVIIYPGLNWGERPEAQAPDFHILGNPTDGTFAEYVAVPEDNVFELPAHLSLQEAAAIPLSGLTAYRACFTRGGLKRGDKVLITGIGGGTVLFAFQFAKAMGAEVYVTSGSPEKIDRAISLGASGGALYTAGNWPEEIKAKSGGIDLVIDSAAGPDFGRLAEVMNPGGRIVNFGQTAGPIGQIPARYLFWKQLAILGTTMGSRDDFEKMLEFYSEKSLKPIIDRVFPLDQIQDAFDYLDAAGQFGKILLEVQPQG